MPADPPAPEADQNFEWSEVLHAWMFRARIYLKRFWWVFLITISLGVGWQAWKQYNQPPEYFSQGTIKISESITLLPQSTQSTIEWSNFFGTELYEMQKPSLFQTTQDHLRILDYGDYNPGRDTPSVNVDLLPGTDVFQLTAVGPSKKYTSRFLDQVMTTFLQSEQQASEVKLQGANLTASMVLQEQETKINELQAELLSFNEGNNTVNIEDTYNAAGVKETQLNDQFDDLVHRYERLVAVTGNETILGNLKMYVDDPAYADLVDNTLLAPEGGVMRPSIENDYLSAKQALQRAGAELTAYSKYLKPAHPKIIDLQRQINDLTGNLQELRIRIAAELTTYRDVLKVNLADAQSQLAAAIESTHNLAVLLHEYLPIKSQLDRAQDYYNKLKENVTLENIQEKNPPQMLQIDDHASDAVPISPSPVKQIGQGALIGLVAGLALIFALAVLDGRIMSVEDLTQRFDDPMLGIIPMQRHVGGQVELLQNNDQRLMFAESCRNIRSSLLYMDRQGQRPRTIVLTSSIPSEGKSTISANLAITLSFASSRTLLVDADLRRGQLHKRFGLKGTPGLSEHLQHGVPLADIIRPTSFENLDLIPCGQYPAQPGELLMGERFTETLEELKKKYDFIIFDSPPVLAADDAASFATRADAVLFVVRAGYTRLRQIRASLENLSRRGVPTYGFVVNFVDHREPGYYTYKYYDYYSYRAPADKV